jgi:hypothetical protein
LWDTRNDKIGSFGIFYEFIKIITYKKYSYRYLDAEHQEITLFWQLATGNWQLATGNWQLTL